MITVVRRKWSAVLRSAGASLIRSRQKKKDTEPRRSAKTGRSPCQKRKRPSSQLVREKNSRPPFNGRDKPDLYHWKKKITLVYFPGGERSLVWGAREAAHRVRPSKKKKYSTGATSEKGIPTKKKAIPLLAVKKGLEDPGSPRKEKTGLHAFIRKHSACPVHQK